MTRDDIIKLAREAGATFDHMTWVERDLAPVFERFAALVAAAAKTEEREACAKVCDLETALWEENSDGQVSLRSVAAVIRARGNT